MASRSADEDAPSPVAKAAEDGGADATAPDAAEVSGERAFAVPDGAEDAGRVAAAGA